MEKKIEVLSQLNAASHYVHADPVRIQQVLWNLINNAVKFTNESGRITIRSLNDGNRLVVEVADTGIGIEPEQQRHIFNAFEQGEPSITRQFGGLGLGLTISKNLIDLHNGEITVQSAGRNRGSTFRVTLNTVDAPVRLSANASNGKAETDRNLRLLIVDDDADTRRILSRLLSKCGHEVVTAEGAQRALQSIQNSRFDALISDIGLPDSSGYELIRMAKQRQCLKGIALSGYGTEEDVRRSIEAGFDYHLTKPVTFQELRSLLLKIV